MNKCKRMTVTAIGIKGTEIHKATNYNKSECKNIPGKCECIHAEIALLDKVIPEIMIISHSPCISCAEAIIEAGVKIVRYKEEYRDISGLVLLEGNGVNVIKY